LSTAADADGVSRVKKMGLPRH